MYFAEPWAESLRNWSLGCIVVGLVALPLSSEIVERNIEMFLLAAGCASVSIATGWSPLLVRDSLMQPMGLAAIVLGVSLGFRLVQHEIGRGVLRLSQVLPSRILGFVLVVTLGLLSSIITAAIASLVLVEVVKALHLNRSQQLRLTVISCFSIGLGAALTPVGEPLSAIVTLKMQEGFWFIARLVWPYVGLCILGLGILAAITNPVGTVRTPDVHGVRQTVWDVFFRAVRFYLFMVALGLLGTGLSPLVDRYIVSLSARTLFWANSVSAILDNATLAAAEMGPSMSHSQVSAALLGLLISGGMLVPGNVPNIIAAHRLGISGVEWAWYAIPVGFALMVVVFSAWMAAP